MPDVEQTKIPTSPPMVPNSHYPRNGPRHRLPGLRAGLPGMSDTAPRRGQSHAKLTLCAWLPFVLSRRRRP
jgi:hypothetical protein